MKYLFMILAELLILVDSGNVKEIKIFPNLPLVSEILLINKNTILIKTQD